MFKKAGTYTLKFILLDTNHQAVAMTYSDPFTVSIGLKHSLSLFNFVGTAFGGEVFSANPIVGVVDKGGNVIKSINTGTVTATLTTTPTGLEKMHPKNSITVPIIDGMANFTGLYINEAGYPYQMTFSTTAVSIIFTQRIQL